MASWKFWLVAGGLGLTLLASPALCQTAAPSGSDASSYAKLGMANGTKGDLNGAIAAFDQAIQIDPKYVPAYFGRGYAHQMQRDFTTAMDDFNKAIELDPGFQPAYFQRGTLKIKAGDSDAAVSDLKEAIKLDAKYAPAYYTLGDVYYFRGDLDGAINQLTQAMALQNDFALGYFIRGLVRHAQGHRLDAQADFQKSEGLNFPYASFWTWITQMEGGQRGLARQHLTNVLNQQDLFKPGEWPSVIANFLLEKTSQEQMEATANQGDPTEIRSRLCEALFYAGMVKHFAGDDKGARDCYTRAVATESKGSEEYVEANRQLSH